MGKTNELTLISGELSQIHQCDNCDQPIISSSFNYWEAKDFTICSICLIGLIDNISKQEPTGKEIIEKQFEEFWLFYPKKVGKKDALRHFERLNKDKKFSFEDFVTGTKNYVDHCNKEDRFLKDASAFVNQETYKDFLEMPADLSNGNVHSKGSKNPSKFERNKELLNKKRKEIMQNESSGIIEIIRDDIGGVPEL